MLFENLEVADVPTPRGHVHARIGGSGPPLLLLHGFPETHVMWHAVTPLLLEHFTLVVAGPPRLRPVVSPAGDRRPQRAQ